VRLALVCLLSTGCAQLLGLDNTTLEQPDGPVDGVCAGDSPSCTASSAGRSACGQLFGAGATAGEPLRVAAPTGEPCGTSTEGPCAFAISAMPMQSLFDGSNANAVTGQIDDCGRFAIGDIDTAIVDVAIRFSEAGGTFQPSATLVVGRTPVAGEADRGIAGYAVLQSTVAEWATQLALTADQVSTGFLVQYTSSNGVTIEGEAVAVDSGSPLTSPPGTIPWAAYFSGPAPFGTLDPAAMTTGPSGTAFAAMPAGPFSLEGFRQGRRCKVENLETVSNVLIHVFQEGC